jgi:hypothetical protein
MKTPEPEPHPTECGEDCESLNVEKNWAIRFDGDSFTEGAMDRSLDFDVHQLGSFAYEVQRWQNPRSRFLVHTDASEYADGGPQRCSFAQCNCYRGRRTKGRVSHCEHVAAVYMWLLEVEAEYES